MDRIDLKILSCLQEDATMPIATIAERAGLSPSPCWRRIQRLDAAGVIRKRVALLDPHSLSAGVTVFVSIRTNRHTREWSEKFCRAVSRLPEVMEFYRMSGQVDYLLRVVVPDIEAYDRVYKQLIEVADLYDVTSSFSMEQINTRRRCRSVLSGQSRSRPRSMRVAVDPEPLVQLPPALGRDVKHARFTRMPQPARVQQPSRNRRTYGAADMRLAHAPIQAGSAENATRLLQRANVNTQSAQESFPVRRNFSCVIAQKNVRTVG